MQIEPATIVSISFERPKRSRDVKAEGTEAEEAAARPSQQLRPSKVPKVVGNRADAEQNFLCGLEEIQSSAVVFSSYKPSVHESSSGSSVIRKLPRPMTSLRKAEYEELSEDQLLSLCEETFVKGILVIHNDEAAYLEESTRLQAQSLLWYEHRIGRITASRFFEVSRASLNPPPTSLVRCIMERNRDYSFLPSIQWGIANEDTARKAFVQISREEHNNFSFNPAGLHVNPKYPHLGASPDGLISCSCCGEGLIEIKCPYKHRYVHPNSVNDRKFYLSRSEDGRLQLSHDHAYYHQVQGQLAVCEKEYCDFICWTTVGMHTERITLEHSYLSKIKPKLDAFFVKVLLPLLLTGRSANVNQPTPQTNAKSSAPSTSGSSSSSRTYCWCNGEESGRMIACDNPKCKIEWFHFECAKLGRKPRGKWFCSEACKTACK